MMRINRRFNVIGTIGNQMELRPVPRVAPTHSFHVIDNATGEEMAIRYTPPGTFMQKHNTSVIRKPIFREIAPNVYQ